VNLDYEKMPEKKKRVGEELFLKGTVY